MSKNNKDEINLIDIYFLIKKNVKVIYLNIMLSISLIVFYLVITPTLYSSYISIYPINDETAIDGAMGNLKGIASSIGLNLGGQSNTLYYIPDIVESRKLQKDIIRNNWKVEKFEDQVNLIEYWEINSDNSNVLLDWVRGIFLKRDFSADKIDMEIAIEYLKDRILYDELESGLIKIQVLMEEPQLSADIANYISLYIDKYIGNDITLQSTKYRIFLEDRLDASKVELKNSEELLTTFRKNNPIALDNPDLQLDRLRLIRNLEVNQELYLTILTQYEIAEMEELKDKPIINILDSADSAVEKYSPKIIKLLFIGILVGIVLAITGILMKYSFDINKINS